MEQRAIWANRYAIFDEIASGGMATVYVGGRLGRVNGRRVVAVKKLFEQYAKDPDFASMFLDEARLAAEIRHPNVIRTYQVLRIPDSLAIVMELVVGVSLADLLEGARARSLATPFAIAGAVMVGALSGLQAAHQATDEMRRPFGLVHRDVSPQNVLVGKDGVPRVIDFGIAKAAGRLHVTTVGMRKGKYAYMSPEQIHGGEVGVAADIYAAGLVLWELLVGWRFFEAPSDVALLAKRAGGDFPVVPPSCASPRVPATVDAVVMRALEADPAARFASAAEMADAVREALGVAPSEEVAAWVDALAHERLATLEAKVQDVEAAFDSGELEELATNAPIDGAARGPAVVEAVAPRPSGVVHALAGSDLRRLGADVEGPVAAIPLAPELERPARPAEEPQGVPVPIANRAPLPAAAPPGAAQRPAGASTAIAPARTAPRARSSGAARASGVAVGVLALLAIGAWRGWPALLRSMVVSGAAKRGVTLTFDGVSTDGLGLALRGVTLRSAQAGDLVVAAPDVRVALDGHLNPVTIHAAPYSVTIHGEAADVGQRFEAWAEASRAASTLPLEVSGEAGTLIWSDAVASGVSLAADGLASGLALGGDTAGLVPASGGPRLHFETRDLTATVGGATLGPWVAHLESTPEQTRLVVALDRTRPDAPPSVTLTVNPALGDLVSVTIPRHKFAYLGVPPAFLGVGPDPEIDLTLTAQALPGGALHADARLALFGVRIPAFADPLDPSALANVTLSGAVSGPAGRALEIVNGTLALRGAVSPMGGAVRLDPGAVTVSLSLQGRDANAPVVLDTRAWTQGRAPPPR